MPGGGIAQGSIFAIFGRGLGPSAPVEVASFPLGNQLAGVSKNLRQGVTQLSAIPLFVQDSQINAILPSATPLSGVSLRGGPPFLIYVPYRGATIWFVLEAYSGY